MGVLALTQAFIYVGPCDVTGASDDLTLRAEADVRERTTWRSRGWRQHKLTLKRFALSTGGFWSSDSAADVDPVFFDGVGQGRVITTGLNETEGETAYLMRGMQTDYAFPEGNIGDLHKFRTNAAGSSDSGDTIRGKLFKAHGHDGTLTSATGPIGTAVQLGAVGALQTLYSTLHTFGTPGSSITVVLESDDNSGFTTATTRVTFGPITTADGFWGTPVAGAITDDWWRFRVTAITGNWVLGAGAAIRTNPS